MPAKKWGAAGTSTLQTPSGEDLHVEGLPRDATAHVYVNCTLHQVNTKTTSVTLHVSRVSAFT